ncbi:hypothetical protein GR254_24425, partial [Mycobacterium tuberculosis]|nr:hypothetical protein [Mycobacterium tuberculosis]
MLALEPARRVNFPVRQDVAEFYGSIATADEAVGRLLDTLADTGLDA